MGTNKTRQLIPSSSNKSRLGFSNALIWEDADESWDDSDPKTWDNATGKFRAIPGIKKTRQSVPSSSNKSRN